jgi:spore germination protein YaaH
VSANSDLFAELSPFWFRATGTTTFANDATTSDQAKVVALARSRNLPLVPSVRDGLPAHAMAAILADPAQRAAHVAALVHLAVANGYAGLDLDYEQFAFADGVPSWSATRPNWVAFVGSLSRALHAQAKLLAVTVPPTYNGSRINGSGYWVYDDGAIAPWVDRLRVMAYDLNLGSPGPVAPLYWVDSILRYMVTIVPPSKLQMGVPAYGRTWVTGITGTCPIGVTPGRFDVRMVNAAPLVATKHATPVRDGRSGELTFTYRDVYTGPAPPPTTAAVATAAVGQSIAARAAVMARTAVPAVATAAAARGTVPSGSPTTATARTSTPSNAPTSTSSSLAPTTTTRPATTTSRPATTTTVAPPTTSGRANRVAPPASAAPPPTVTAATTPTVTCVVSRVTWYSDATTMQSRAALIGKYHLSGMSQWALGYEAASEWPPIRNVLGNLPHPPGKDPIGQLQAVRAGVRRLSVVGWAMDPETDLPTAVVISISGIHVALLSDVNRPDVAAAYAGAGPFHGFSATVAVSPGVHQVCASARAIGPGDPSRPIGCVTVTVPG